MLANKVNRTMEQHGLHIEWTHAPSCPGPGARGMATCDTALWMRINEGPWWRPRSEYRSFLRAFDAIWEAETSEQVEFIVQGDKQYAEAT